MSMFAFTFQQAVIPKIFFYMTLMTLKHFKVLSLKIINW